MKKLALLLATTACIMITGCAQMILNAHRKIETRNFDVQPAVNMFAAMTLPDEETKAKLVGTWISNGYTQTFTETDINGKPFQYVNAAPASGEATFKFGKDKSVIYKIRTITHQQQQNSQSHIQMGSWDCKNGILQITLHSDELNQDFTVPAIVIWKDKDSFELRWDVKAFSKMLKNTMQKNGKMPQGTTLDDYAAHYDKQGNFYNFMKVTALSGKYDVRSRATTKQPPQIFKRQK
ncbi:MAG: hypothetical protein J6W81_00565 [Lentisphaeria bacterium]|nr:hypothetical protein [Lentisphaeria bacterium]